MKTKLFHTFVLSFFILLVYTVSYAQQPVFQWAKHIESQSSLTSGILDFTLDNNKNVLVVGYFYDSLDVDPSSSTNMLYAVGQSDSYLAKYDSLGQLLWAHHIGNVYNDRINTVACDSAGNIYTGGYFRNTIDLDPTAGIATFTTGSNNECFLQKFDVNGNFIWAKTFGSTNGSDEVDELTVTPYGDVICSGTYQSTADFDPGPAVQNVTFAGWLDVFLLRLNTNGDFIWVKSFGGIDAELVRTLEIDSSENIYLAGVYEGTADFDPSSATLNLTANGGFDTYLLKLNSTGDLQWAKTYNTNQCGLLTPDLQGNVYLAGGFTNSCNFDLGGTNTTLTANSFFSDGFVVKLDSSGNFSWVKHLDGNVSHDAINVAAIDAQNNVYLGGSFIGTASFDNAITLTSAGVNDAFVLKLDTAGSLQWAKTFTGTTNVFANDVKIDVSNSVYTVGGFVGTIDFDPSSSTFNLSTSGASFNGYMHKMAMPQNNDAGVLAIQPSTCEGVQALPITVKNFGGNTIDTLGIEWEINGITQPSLFIGDTILPDNTLNLFLDTFSFLSNQTYTIKVFTVLPNNAADPQGFNDTLTFIFQPQAAYNYTQSITICAGDSLTIGTNNYTAPGLYTDSFTTALGCDSLVHTQLNVLPVYLDTLNVSICNNSSYLFGGTTLNAAGIYTDSLQAANGCDSIVVLNLQVNPIFNDTLQVVICQNDSYSFNGIALSTSGFYTDSLTSTLYNCDSVITVHLEVNPIFSDTITTTICSNENYTLAGIAHNTAGTFTYTLQTNSGCDSVVTLNLSVLPAISDTLSAEICAGETFMGYSTTGIYTTTFTAFNGCDSIQVVDLMVFNNPTVFIQQINDSTLSASIATNYQWYLNGVILPNDTNQTIIPTQSGLYSVVVENNAGCSAQSNDFQFVMSSVHSELNNERFFTIAPNPNQGSFYVKAVTQILGDFELQIVQLNGQIIFQQTVQLAPNTGTLIQTNNLANGTYLVLLKNEQTINYQQLLTVH